MIHDDDGGIKTMMSRTHEVGQLDLTPVSQISVIVPVFNVEKYLRQCLDSLAGQTMKEIEIILIDDGSTDHSGSICDEYAEKDPRFRVFHKENRGLSAARNLGIEKAQSDWLMFVDSDDWVDSRFCELPYQAAMTYNADMIIFRSKKATVKGRIKHRKPKSLTVGLITQETAIDYSDVAVWNKLYKKKLFSNIRYPEGHVFEDTATTYKLILSASRIVMMPDTLIYYRYRKDSISNSRTNISEQDFFSFSIQKYKDLISLGYPEEKERKRLQTSAMAYCIHMEPSDDALFQYAEKILSDIRTFPQNATWQNKVMFLIWKTNKNLFHNICKTFGKKVKP